MSKWSTSRRRMLWTQSTTADRLRTFCLNSKPSKSRTKKIVPGSSLADTRSKIWATYQSKTVSLSIQWKIRSKSSVAIPKTPRACRCSNSWSKTPSVKSLTLVRLWSSIYSREKHSSKRLILSFTTLMASPSSSHDFTKLSKEIQPTTSILSLKHRVQTTTGWGLLSILSRKQFKATRAGSSSGLIWPRSSSVPSMTIRKCITACKCTLSHYCSLWPPGRQVKNRATFLASRNELSMCNSRNGWITNSAPASAVLRKWFLAKMISLRRANVFKTWIRSSSTKSNTSKKWCAVYGMTSLGKKSSKSTIG